MIRMGEARLPDCAKRASRSRIPASAACRRPASIAHRVAVTRSLLILGALLATLTQPLSAQMLDTTRLWALFHGAGTGVGTTDDGLAEVRRLRGAFVGVDSARLDAYEGAFRTMTAQETIWPPSKLSRALEGLALLDAAVLAAPDHPEIRYLRLAICHHLPSLFRRGDTVRNDAAVLADLLTSDHLIQDPTRTAAMVAFLLSEKLVSDSMADSLRLDRG